MGIRGKEVTSREPWEELVLAENEYIARRMALYSAGAERQLRLAFASPRGVGTALRALIDAPLELIMSLLDVLFVSAASTHPQVGVARQVIDRLDPGWLSSALRPLVAGRLSQSDASWEDYRRIAELLSTLEQRSILDVLVRRAEASDDPDIREVADDFREFGS